MRIKLSRSQWEEMGKMAGWISSGSNRIVADNLVQDILSHPPKVILEAIRKLGEENIAGFSGVKEEEVSEVLAMCEESELAEILNTINKGLGKVAADVSDWTKYCPRCGKKYVKHHGIKQCPDCFLNYSPHAQSDQSAVYDPETGKIRTGPTEKIFPKHAGDCGGYTKALKDKTHSGKLDTQLFPECEGHETDRDVVKKTRERQQKPKSKS